MVTRLSKHEIIELIDLIIFKATGGLFTGDERDGDAPPITLQNFHSEKTRLGAQALRARLSRLSPTEVRNEALAGLAHHERHRKWISQTLAEEHRERQAERGRKHGLQPAILAAARHYRGRKGRKIQAGEAWRAIKKEPYQTSDGDTVMMEGDEMRVQSRAGTQKRAGIRFNHWQRRYWPKANT
jgi:hypothetical protein